MTHWLSFFAIILVQAGVLAAVEFYNRSINSDRRLSHRFADTLIAALVGGLVLGALFDMGLGRQLGIFDYYLHSHTFYLANGILSYGLAIATALRVAAEPLQVNQITARREVVLLLMLCLACITNAAYFQTGFSALWATGAIIVTFGELVELYYLRTAGPVVEALSGRYLAAIKNWLIAICIGAAYELGNFLFPVWSWSFDGLGSRVTDTMLIVLFGYVVLLHACRTFGLIIIRLKKDLLAKRAAKRHSGTT